MINYKKLYYTSMVVLGVSVSAMGIACDDRESIDLMRAGSANYIHSGDIPAQRSIGDTDIERIMKRFPGSVYLDESLLYQYFKLFNKWSNVRNTFDANNEEVNQNGEKLLVAIKKESNKYDPKKLTPSLLYNK